MVDLDHSWIAESVEPSRLVMKRLLVQSPAITTSAHLKEPPFSKGDELDLRSEGFLKNVTIFIFPLNISIHKKGMKICN